MSRPEDPFSQFKNDFMGAGARERNIKDEEFDDNPQEEEESIDLYAVLNVSKQATANEIQIAYKRLAFTYHPDKQMDPVLKEESQKKFALISMARDTLCDERQRAIYDRYGIKGLTNAQSIINKYEDVDNLLKAIGKIEKTIKEERELDGFLPRTDNTVSMGYISDYDKYFLRNIVSFQTYNIKTNFAEIQLQNSMMHEFLTNGTSVGCGVLVRKFITPRIQMNALGALDRNTSPAAALGVKMMISDRRGVAVEISTMNNRPSLKLGFVSNIVPGLDMDINTVLSKTNQNIMMNLERNVEDRILRLSANVSRGVEDGFYTSITRELPISKRSFISFSVEGKGLGFNKFSTTISRRLSKVMEVDLTLSLAKDHFLYIFSLRHKYQSIEIPIPIYTNVSLKHSIIFFTIPTVLFSMFKLCVLNPLQKRKEKIRLEERKKKYLNEMEDEKQKAAIDIQLMKPSVDKKVAVERSKNGLIIQEAWYGVLDERGRPTNEHPDFPSYIDVTIPLQYLVEESKLELYANKKSDLLGFWDPRIGEFKRLKVTYFFQGKLHQVVVGDEDPMRLPLRSHLMMN